MMVHAFLRAMGLINDRAIDCVICPEVDRARTTQRIAAWCRQRLPRRPREISEDQTGNQHGKTEGRDRDRAEVDGDQGVEPLPHLIGRKARAANAKALNDAVAEAAQTGQRHQRPNDL